MQAATVPRTLLIAAHPDDETIGAAIRISRTPGIRIVHITEGSPLDLSDAIAAGFTTHADYAAARRRETLNALALAGVSREAYTNLCFIDQRVSFELEHLTQRLLSLLTQFRPDVVLTHAYEGGHPDHDSTAFACHAARRLYELEHPRKTFQLVEFTSYHADSGGIRTYDFLPIYGCKEERHTLTSRERELKLSMLRQFKSQERTLAPFMEPQVEALREAPVYNFRRPPHSGRLFYEYFDWGLDGATWRDLAHDAERHLLHPSRLAA